MPSFLDRFRGSDVNPGDRELIQHMLRAGQELNTRPRETTHYLHFNEPEAAQEAAEGAAAAGYDAEVVGPDGLVDWQVRARHTITVNEEAITAARRRLTAVAEEAGGVYDGWDTYSGEALDQMVSH